MSNKKKHKAEKQYPTSATIKTNKSDLPNPPKESSDTFWLWLAIKNYFRKKSLKNNQHNSRTGTSNKRL